MNRPLCFVLMPFGQKPAESGRTIDFDAVYRELIAPAIEEAGLSPLRADEEQGGGIIHKPMYERLLLAEYAVADLTSANPNVFYELGIRHAARPHATVLLYADGLRLPFDVAPLRALPYTLSADGKPQNVNQDKSRLAEKLRESRRPSTDSPLFQLVEGYPSEIDHTRTDVFRDRAQYSAERKARLAAARKSGVDAVRQVEAECSPIYDQESGVVIDLFLSYRALKAWKDMIDLVPKMSEPLQATTMVQEQLAFALNRAGRSDDAEQVLLALIERRGSSSETLGLLGRVYKDRWEQAAKGGDPAAGGFLKKAIDTYVRGFETDWRDAYPGVNAVTLMEQREPPDRRMASLLPVVAYAVERKIDAGKPDYWDYATRLELAVLSRDQDRADEALADALAAVRETWEPETTARNIRLIREARERRKEDVSWIAAIENACVRRAQG